MATPQPNSTDKLNSPDHSLMHRQIAADTAAAVKSIEVLADGIASIPQGTLIKAVPGTALASGMKIVLTSTGTFNFGDVGYIKSDGTVGFADASVIATASALVMCADAQIASTSGNWLLYGMAQLTAWNWTPGGLIYLTITGTTGNTLSQAQPTATNEVVQVLGVATAADNILFTPQLVQVELA